MNNKDRRILCEITNMILIKNKNDGSFVAIMRELSWCGLSLPGGHIEPGESMYASAVREAYEETGLTVKNLRLSCLVNWCKRGTNERYLVYIYVTDEYSGELKKRTEEGNVFFTTINEVKSGKYPLANKITEYIINASENGFCELYCEYDESGEAMEVIIC